ncbi:hypothetical protein OIDMADRAFT_25874 [Oidiodendron maius Zn]|uniref:Type I restriction enzyme R protein N-terminal domain-containing protein n=1 Tax=Oidiodendron maius (strain Zn) TaxID=913774 RepID=A0A0C3HAN3_OIDMZ|nr:hypothetical protein OIDMADRAFT_25874 [Oidiodendron maius Zn]
MCVSVMRELAVALAGTQNRGASVRDQNNNNNNEKKEITLNMTDYFNDEWVKLAYSKISDSSYEDKVDQLWANILSIIFPRSSNFLVLQQYHLDKTAIPDIVVKFFRDGQEQIVLVMENKRSDNGHGWDEGISKLERYLI